MDIEMDQNKNTTSSSVTKPSEETVLIWLVPLVVIGVLIVMSNVLTIITFVVNSHLRRRSVYCLINLSVADALYGAVLTSYSWCVLGVTFFDWKVDFKTRGMFIPSLITIMGSLLSLVVVCLDRVYATFFPFHHRTARPRVYTFTFIITWSLALLTSLMYHLTPRTKTNFPVVFYWFLLALSLFVMIISYISIFLKIKAQNAFHQQHQQQARVIRNQMRERHLAVTLFIVTLLSLLTWLPFLFVRALNPARYTFHGRLTVLPRSYCMVFLIQASNSLVNPIVYLFRMRDFRSALFSLLLRCSKHSRRVHPENWNTSRENGRSLELEATGGRTAKME